MNAISKFLGTAIIGGLLIVLPAYLVVIMVVGVVGEVSDLLEPVVELFPINHEYDEFSAKIAAIALIVGVCFVFGLISQIRFGAAFGRWFKRTVLERIPGYKIIDTLVGRLAGGRSDTFLTPAAIELLTGVTSLGFIIEEQANGDLTVFVPSSPTATTGNIYSVSPDRVRRLDVKSIRVLDALSLWGMGTGRILHGDEPAKT